MKIIIIGAGAVGFQIAKQLISENKDIIVIEKNPDRAKYVSNALDCIVINDEGNNLEVLKSVDIHDADFFISVTDSDEVNMISCALVSSEFNIPNKIARVRNIDYSRAGVFSKKFMGIDYIVNPEVEAAKEIVNTVRYGAIGGVKLFEKTNVQMRSIFVDEDSYFKDKSLKEIKFRLNEDFLIAGISRGDEVIIPTGDSMIREDDSIYLVATDENLEKVFAKIGKIRERLKKVVIVGGGKTGSYVARYLLKKGRRLTIIDNDYNNCKLLSEQFPDALIINGDITDETIFAEEQLHTYDLIITTTPSQELNMLTAIYAKTLGTKRAVALVTNTNYLTIASHLDIDSTVSPKNSAVDTILKFIRKGNIKSLHSIFEGKAEVIEFSVEQNDNIVNKALKDIQMPTHSLILAINRDSNNYIPDGNFVIHQGDNIITIAKKESIPKIEDMFIET